MADRIVTSQAVGPVDRGHAPVLRSDSGLPRAAKSTLAAVVVLTAVVLPVSLHRVGPQPAFLPAVVSAVLLVQIASVYLLVTRFRDTGDGRLLVMALAYVWASIVVVGYALTFPGLVSSRPPLSSWPSAASWFYLAWHIGFPVLLAVAWGYPRLLGTAVEPARRRRVAQVLIGGCSAAAALTVAFIAVLGEHVLPDVIVGTDTIRLSIIGGPPAMILAIGSAFVVTRGLRGHRGPERWAMVTAWVAVADLTLTFVSHNRYALGWYAARSLTFVCSSLVFVAMLAEFTALQRRLLSERRWLHRQTRTDDLTGLANRLALREFLAELIRSNAPGAVMVLDLDRFKFINDSLGHEAGDAVIVETGQRIAGLCPGDLVVRLGGDEFAVVLVSGVNADKVASALLDAIGRPFELLVGGARSRVTVGVSIGITALARQSSASEVLREADLALYRAKDGGRGRFTTFDSELREHNRRRVETETTIRKALDDGSLVLKLQPIVSVGGCATRGYLLQAGLQAADGDPTPNRDLIDVAEQSGLIVDVDARMLLAAARMVAADDDGRLGILGVSMSARTLVHPGLGDLITEVSELAGSSTHRIAVHVSELVLIEDAGGAAEGIAALRAGGLQVGLGDFGTRLSVLDGLRRVPLDFLKVVRPEPAEFDEVPGQRALMDALLSVAVALDLTVVMDDTDDDARRERTDAMARSLNLKNPLGRPAPIETASSDQAGTSPLEAVSAAAGSAALLRPPVDRRVAHGRRPASAGTTLTRDHQPGGTSTTQM